NHGSSLLEKFISAGVDIGGIIATKSPTTTKIRVIGGHQQMLRLDFEDGSPPVKADADKIKRYITERLNESMDAVIISDYGKGIVTEDIAKFTIDEAHNHGVPVIVDPKGVHWGKHKGADFVTPNLKEINDIMVERVANEDDEVEKAARYVMRKFAIKNVIVTRSEKGLTLMTNSVMEHIPTESREVFDVSGAGDTVIAVFSTAIAGGLSPADSARLANLAASVVVAKVGTYAVSQEELLQAIKKNMEEI
ncbi:MAG: bifunctional hydroxymethylpyrimidine kinase/phosphomethylpyrimidine kinase, partial [Selenomonadaceae bacterium]|nr:bifunctional hydroxymethylpyrimidine kinase/phosphomethylpyrimidine kinase [Selenomonadaceae bacterium]